MPFGLLGIEIDEALPGVGAGFTLMKSALKDLRQLMRAGDHAIKHMPVLSRVLIHRLCGKVTNLH